MKKGITVGKTKSNPVAPPTNSRMCAVIYARSATDEGSAIARQVESCQVWAQAHAYSVLAEYSEVMSGIGAEPTPAGSSCSACRQAGCGADPN
jgi:hypothetical protein